VDSLSSYDQPLQTHPRRDALATAALLLAVPMPATAKGRAGDRVQWREEREMGVWPASTTKGIVMELLAKIDPQPPEGIKYMLGGEEWKPEGERSPIRLMCEEWGNLGPMELNPEIEDNGNGFRVRATEILAPAGAIGFTDVDGVYFWTDTDQFGRTKDERWLCGLPGGIA
jgi:hypothetical protein